MLLKTQRWIRLEESIYVRAAGGERVRRRRGRGKATYKRALKTLLGKKECVLGVENMETYLSARKKTDA